MGLILIRLPCICIMSFRSMSRGLIIRLWLLGGGRLRWEKQLRIEKIRWEGKKNKISSKREISKITMSSFKIKWSSLTTACSHSWRNPSKPHPYQPSAHKATQRPCSNHKSSLKNNPSVLFCTNQSSSWTQNTNLSDIKCKRDTYQQNKRETIYLRWWLRSCWRKWWVMILSMMSLEGLRWVARRKEVEGMGRVGRSGGNSKIKRSRSMRRNKSLKEDSKEIRK